MGWYIGGGVLYLVLIITLGVMTLRNGHTWMFFLGLIFPLLWFAGALMKPQNRY